MALDSLTAVGFFPQYFPEFARSELEFEYQCSLARIWDYLNQGAEFLCTHPGTFMHLMRLLTALPDDAVRDFPSKSRLVLSLWDLVGVCEIACRFSGLLNEARWCRRCPISTYSW